MKFKYLLRTLFCTLLMATLSFEILAQDNVAKVIILRGSVKAKLADGSIIDVKADQSLPEGASVQTAEKSFVKLMFIDKSQMNLGPNSQMVINAFPKKEAGIITLVKGQIRSQVTKDYMEMDDKSKSKLYIKTKTAAMGIRGTDFQVNYNPENQNTALITFEGKVAMAHIGRDTASNVLNQQNLERVVSSDKAVMVTQGQISAVNLNVSERAMIPTKLGTKQIEALESNETGLKESSATDSSKQFRNPIPPGADGAAFSNSLSTLNNEMAAVSKNAGATIDKSTSAEGYFNVNTGEYKLPAGSIVDLATVNIIPPPVNAVFDNNSGTYTVPETFGKIDKATGEYKAPIGLQLGVDGKFTVVDTEAYSKSVAVPKEEKKAEEKKTDDKKADDKKDEKQGDKQGDKKEEKKDDRSPASVAPAAAVDIKAPELFTGSAAQAFIATFAAPVVKPPPPPPGVNTPQRTDLAAIANNVLQKNDQVKQTATERGVVTPSTTKVKIILDAQ